MADQSQTGAVPVVTNEEAPVIIPAGDGGFWVLVQGSSCTVTQEAPSAAPPSPSLLEMIKENIPGIAVVTGGALIIVGVL